MKKVHSRAGGIDIGAKKVFVFAEGHPVRSYDTFTADFHELCRWLLSCKVVTVAMEATGSYWVILYDILVASGLDVWLVDGRQTMQVPGRKTDVKDCQWIQQLHSHGLLSRCHVVDGYIKELRSYERQRKEHITAAGMHTQHMQKALLQMNIRLKEVISQLHGKSGLRMIQAILGGQRDKHALLSLCDKRMQEEKGEQILKSLEGYYRDEHLFALQQAYNAYLFYQDQIVECDQKISEVLCKINAGQKAPKTTKGSRKPIRHHKPAVKNLGKHMIQAFGGKDATALPGITDYTMLQILAETGSDLSKWKTEKHFAAWLGLAPGQHHSGKMKRNRRRKGKPRAGQIFRLLAQSIIQSKKIALGAFGRRLKSRKGPAIATKAVARKLAEMLWRFMVKGAEFVEKGVAHYEEQLKQHKLKYLNRLAAEFEFNLQPAHKTCHG